METGRPARYNKGMNTPTNLMIVGALFFAGAMLFALTSRPGFAAAIPMWSGLIAAALSVGVGLKTQEERHKQ